MDEIGLTPKDKDSFFSNYVEKRIPVLIKNGIREWPLMKKWSNEYVISHFGSYTYTIVKDSRSGVSSDNNIKATLENYFAHHRDGSAFLREAYNRKAPPLFFEDIELPNFFFSEPDIASYFFFHAPPSGGALPHFHPFEVFNMLQQGSKQWVLFDADPATSVKGSLLVRQYRDQYGKNTFSRDWFKDELPTLNQKADKVYECIQRGGDIVYIPFNFCHAVLNVSEVMGLIVEISR